MDQEVSLAFSKYGLQSVPTIASGAVHGDGDRLMPGYLREDKHRATKSWGIGQDDFWKAYRQALKVGRSLLFVSRNKDREILVSMELNQFLQLLAKAENGSPTESK